MTMTRTFGVWRRASDLPLWRMMGDRIPVGPWPLKIQWCAFEITDYFARPLDLDSFMTGASEYDISSDEAYCPCGATLPNWDGSAGDLLRMIYQHCGAAGHPMPRFER